MRQAQEFERGSFVLYSGGTSDSLERLLLTTRLRGALERRRVPPGVPADVFEMKVAAVEALLRWDDPHHGVISPMRFIPSAEHSGLIGPTGDWVIDTACAQMRAWLDLALEVRVAVNVALLQFRDVDRLRTCLAHCGVPPSQLIVEITESTAMRATECVEPVLERCSSSASRWRSTTSGWATAEQQKMIDERGSTCYGQGFHLARPMTPDRIPEILRAR